jgi:hypothetical protein
MLVLIWRVLAGGASWQGDGLVARALVSVSFGRHDESVRLPVTVARQIRIAFEGGEMDAGRYAG